MAMLTKNNEIIQNGNSSDVCIYCASKAKKSLIDARRENKGALEGKLVFRIDSEKCLCIECIKELAQKLESPTEGEITL